MSSKIKKLDLDLINKIAAGEVVERPASAIKELIENSLDAGAQNIIVEIKNGGLDYIQVTDDGQGMTREDLELAIQRHATSKISSLQDLHRIQSMGFRGEALAAISSVSKFTIKSKTANELGGTQVYVENGRPVFETISAQTGTSVSAEELFYNVPARKKFLKTANTEYNHSLSIFLEYAIYYYKINWKLIHNGKLIFNLPKTDRHIDRLKQVLGREISEHLLEIKVKGPISIFGFVSQPKISRSNKKSQYLYVNNRPVKDYMIAKAVQQAYSSVLTDSEYPVFVLDLEIDPREVDVNVHPRKTEVKFSKPNEVYRYVLSAVKNLLVQNNLITTADLVKSFAEKPVSFEPADDSGFVFKSKPNIGFKSQKLYSSKHATPQQIKQALDFTQKIAQNSLNNESSTIDQDLGDWKLIGQLHNSYLIVETPNGFLLIDQHAAAERLNYEKFKQEAASQKVKSQKLLMPHKIELGLREAEILKSSEEILKSLGFEIESFGGQTFMIQAVPQTLSKINLDELTHGLLADLEGSDFYKEHDLEKKKEIVIKYAACRGAIMFNDRLTTQEQLALLKDIKKLPLEKYTCCHGRPFLKEFLKTDLEKLFHRK